MARPHRHVFRLAYMPATDAEGGEWLALCKCGERIDIVQPAQAPVPYQWPSVWYRSYIYPYTVTTGNGTLGTTARLVCSCPPDRGDNYAGTCAVHDTTFTYTSLLNA